MPRRKPHPDYSRRGVFVGQAVLNGCRRVRSRNALGRTVSLRAAVQLEDIQATVDELWAELDVIDPLPDGVVLPILISRDHLYLI